MSKLYLITGFLGAGKTTFLKNFLRLFPGKSVLLIVNEFGQVGVDDVLLSPLSVSLQSVVGGSVFCSCRFDQFEKALQESVKVHADVILVEASGLSDPTGVRKLFTRSDRFPHIEYCGAVCLVDAIRFPKLYETAQACVKQLAASDVAVVNKLDLATAAQREETLAKIHGQRPDLPIYETALGNVDPAILGALEQARQQPPAELPLTADLTSKKLLITLSPAISSYDLQKFIDMFLDVTFRVKGFVRTREGLFLADCVGNVVCLQPHSGSVPEDAIGRLVILSGAGMPVRKRVKEACLWYSDYVLSLE